MTWPRFLVALIFVVVLGTEVPVLGAVILAVLVIGGAMSTTGSSASGSRGVLTPSDTKPLCWTVPP